MADDAKQERDQPAESDGAESDRGESDRGESDQAKSDQAAPKSHGFDWRGLGGGGHWKVKLFDILSGRLAAIVILLAFAALRILDPLPLQVMRSKTFDVFHNIKPREVPEFSPVTIIDIDEKSLREVGQWPWARTTIADLVARLRAMGAAVVAFDMVFAEPDRLSPANVADALPLIDEETRTKLSSLPSNDNILAQTIKGQPVVLGLSGTDDLGAENIEVDPPQPTSLGWKTGKDVTEPMKRTWLQATAALVHNVPVLEDAAAGRGLFNVTQDVDGIIRRVPMIMRVGDATFASLTMEALRVAFGRPTLLVRAPDPFGIQDLALSKQIIVKTDESGNIWPYYRPFDKKFYVSAVDVLTGTAPLEMIGGRIVFIGTSAVGLKDIRSTPLDRFIPGVDVHAQIIENILQVTPQGIAIVNQQLTRSRNATMFETFGAVATGLVMIVLVPMLGARWTLLAFLVVTGGLIGGAWYQYAELRSLYDPVYPALSALLLYMILTYANYTREEAQRRQVRGAFSRYMSPALVERLAKDPDQLKLGGEMKDMTLLFCDVRGFTTISEMFDAEGLTRLINKFLTPLTDVILQRNGTIDKYMGDCIMAFWNAPLDDDKHADHACESALAMMEALAPINVQLEEEAKEEGRKHVPLKVGIGLNSGQACVGNMGSDQRFDYSVLGDTVNLASRLEGQSKTYGVTIVIGEETHVRATEYATLELDLIRVKGKFEPVRIHTLLGRPDFAKSPAFVKLKETHDAMLAAYRAQKWDDMDKLGAECKELGKAVGFDLTALYDLYHARAEVFRKDPPGEDWDGVFVATTK